MRSIAARRVSPPALRAQPAHRRRPRETRSSAGPRRLSVSGDSGFIHARQRRSWPLEGWRPRRSAGQRSPRVGLRKERDPPSPPERTYRGTACGTAFASRSSPLISHLPARPSPSCGAGSSSCLAGLRLRAQRTVHEGSAECRSAESSIQRRKAGISRTHLQSGGEDSPRFRGYILPIFRTCNET